MLHRDVADPRSRAAAAARWDRGERRGDLRRVREVGSYQGGRSTVGVVLVGAAEFAKLLTARVVPCRRRSNSRAARHAACWGGAWRKIRRKLSSSLHVQSVPNRSRGVSQGPAGAHRATPQRGRTAAMPTTGTATPTLRAREQRRAARAGSNRQAVTGRVELLASELRGRDGVSEHSPVAFSRGRRSARGRKT